MSELLVDFVDKISMELPILYFKEAHVDISILGCICHEVVFFYLEKTLQTLMKCRNFHISLHCLPTYLFAMGKLYSHFLRKKKSDIISRNHARPFVHRSLKFGPYIRPGTLTFKVKIIP